MQMPFFISENVDYSLEKNVAHGKVYKFNTSVITSHVFDQVHVFFFFVHCMFLRLDSTPTVTSRIIDTWTVIGKEDVDHNNYCHQL